MRAKRSVRARRRAAASGVATPSRRTAAPNPSATIRPHSSGMRRDGKPLRHREIEAVREIAIAAPFAVGAEIGDRGFDFDDDQIARPAERQDVGAAAIGEREFEQAGIAELGERAAGAARQTLGQR